MLKEMSKGAPDMAFSSTLGYYRMENQGIRSPAQFLDFGLGNFLTTSTTFFRCQLHFYRKKSISKEKRENKFILYIYVLYIGAQITSKGDRKHTFSMSSTRCIFLKKSKKIVIFSKICGFQNFENCLSPKKKNIFCPNSFW